MKGDTKGFLGLNPSRTTVDNTSGAALRELRKDESIVLVVMRFSAREPATVERNFKDREDLKARYGCTYARLLVDVDDANSMLVLLEFPSEEKAQGYLVATATQSAGKELTDIRDRVVGYYQDVATAVPLHRAS